MAQEAQVSSEHVRQALTTMAARDQQVLTNVDFVAASMTTAGEYLSALGDSAKVETYKGIMQELGRFAHEVNTHKEMLTGVSQEYQASQEETDFRALLDARLAQSLQANKYNPRSDPKMAEFLTAVGQAAPAAGGGGGGAEDEEMEEDVELVAGAQQGWQRETCPISLKSIFDLDQPVKDKRGYVYERAAIMDYLRGQPHGAKHPVAGVQLTLYAHELTDAVEVLREKRRQRLRAAMGGNAEGGGGPGPGPSGQQQPDVIDV